MTDREQLIEAATVAIWGERTRDAASLAALAVDAVESALRAEIEAEYEQVGWTRLNLLTGHWIPCGATDEGAEPVFRRVAEIGATPPKPCSHSAVRVIYPGTAVDVGGYYCADCDERRDGGRMVRDDDGSCWWESLDWDGDVIARSWRGGPGRKSETEFGGDKQ